MVEKRPDNLHTSIFKPLGPGLWTPSFYPLNLSSLFFQKECILPVACVVRCRKEENTNMQVAICSTIIAWFTHFIAAQRPSILSPAGETAGRCENFSMSSIHLPVHCCQGLLLLWSKFHVTQNSRGVLCCDESCS